MRRSHVSSSFPRERSVLREAFGHLKINVDGKASTPLFVVVSFGFVEPNHVRRETCSCCAT